MLWWFTCIISFHPHKNPKIGITVIFYVKKDILKHLSNLPKVVQVSPICEFTYVYEPLY